MRYLKTAALLTVAAVALMAFAAGAAANPTLTSPKETAYFGTLHAVSEGHVSLATPNQKVECASTAEGQVESNGTPATVASKVLTFGAPTCTNNWHVTVVSAGTISISSAGSVTSTGMTVEATRFGGVCRYVTSATPIGTLTGSDKTGGTATLHVNGSIPIHSGGALCGNEATKWEGSYKVNTPDALYID